MNFKELIDDCNKEPVGVNYHYVESRGVAYIYPSYTTNPKNGDDDHAGFTILVESEEEAKRIAEEIRKFEDHAYGNAITNVSHKLIKVLDEILRYVPGIQRKTK